MLGHNQATIHSTMSSLSSHMLQSIIFLASEIAITALILGCSSPNSKVSRLFGLALVITAAYLTFQTTLHHVESTMWAGVFGGNAATYVLRYLDLALLDRWSFETGGPTKQNLDLKQSKNVEEKGSEGRTGVQIRPGTLWQRFLFGLNVTLNPRQLDTRFQVKNVPPWSSSDPKSRPTRASFLRSTAIKVLASYLIVDLCSLGAQPERNQVMFSRERIGFFSRLRQPGIEEVVLRVLASLTLWLNIYCLFRVFHGLLGFVFVGLGINEVKHWAPPFGSLSKANSVRRFWGYVGRIIALPLRRHTLLWYVLTNERVMAVSFGIRCSARLSVARLISSFTMFSGYLTKR